VEHHELAHAVDAREELREEGGERRARLVRLGAAVGGRVAHAVGGGDAGEAELVEVARQRRLGDVPAAGGQQAAKLLLAAHRVGGDELEDRAVAVALVAQRHDGKRGERRAPAGT
jgi:hypothetical protein